MAIDLDKGRAARREAKGEGPVVTFCGKDYRLPVEMPIGVLEAFHLMSNEDTAAGALSVIASALLGEHYEPMKKDGLSVDDLNDLIGGIMGEYGVSNPLPSSTS